MLISIIVPVYKVEKFIYRCIKSIMMQTLNNFELILVDDGSLDKSGYICDAFATMDDRIYVIHKPNGGLSDARNAGIDWSFACSDSEWLNFIDSDDWVHPKCLEALYNAVIETKCQIGICGFQKTLSDELVYENTDINIETVNTEDFFCEQNVNAVVAWGKLYKKELFEKIRYPFGKLHEDEFTTYKLLFQYDKCAFVNQPLYYYFQNAESITRSRWSTKRLDGLEAFRFQMEYFSIHNKERAYFFLLKHYTYNLLRQISFVVNSDYLAKEIVLNDLKKKLKRHIKICNQNGLYRFKDDDCKYIYEIAYPIEMKVYWYWQAIKRKIRRM